MASSRRQHPRWLFFSGHLRVLACLADDPDQTLREVAEAVGLTERRVQAVVKELEEEGYIAKRGRAPRRRYEIRLDQPVREPLFGHLTVGDMLECLRGLAPPGGALFARAGNGAGRTAPRS